MLVYGIAVTAALLIPLFTLGSYKRLFETKLHWSLVLVAGLAIQIGLEYFTLPRRDWNTIGYGLLVASYVLLIIFIARNVVLRGMSIVLIGIACNALVITLNHGMPVKIPPEWRNQSWTAATVKHHPQRPSDRAIFLSDIIILRHPYDAVISFGDLILAVGLCDVAYNVSRKPRRRSRKARRGAASRSARNGSAHSASRASAPPAAAPSAHRRTEPSLQ